MSLETPTLRIEPSGENFVIIATSYNRDAPSGLGEFGTEAEANAAMKGLQSRLDARPAKGPSKKEIRKVGAD